ncbi:MAG: hypothetical protein ACI8WP_000818, partial [Flavobacteriaceae bacterium]
CTFVFNIVLNYLAAITWLCRVICILKAFGLESHVGQYALLISLTRCNRATAGGRENVYLDKQHDILSSLN